MEQESQEFYSEKRKKEDKETFWVYYVTRPISFWITPLFLKMGFSANQVTYLMIAINFLFLFMMAINNYWVVLAAALLMQFRVVLDSVDGNIARYKKTFSTLGKFLEEMDGCILSAIFFSAIGLSASHFPGFLPFGIEISPFAFIILGILTSFFIVFRHLVFRHYEAVYSPAQNLKNESFFAGKGISVIYRTVIKFLGIYSLAQPLLVLAILFNFLGIYTILYFLMHAVAMSVNVGILFLRAAKTKNV